MMDDFDKDKDVLVSRKVAVELLKKWADGYEYIEIPTKDAIEEFMRLPSARQYIRCPQHINQFTLSQIQYENTFCGEDCEIAKAYGDCFHCFASSISKRDKEIEKSAQKIVRCRDCRFHENEQPGMVYCPAVVGGWVENDWFCKGGERREDE